MEQGCKPAEYSTSTRVGEVKPEAPSASCTAKCTHGDGNLTLAPMPATLDDFEPVKRADGRYELLGSGGYG